MKIVPNKISEINSRSKPNKALNRKGKIPVANIACPGKDVILAGKYTRRGKVNEMLLLLLLLPRIYVRNLTASKRGALFSFANMYEGMEMREADFRTNLFD